MATKRRICKCGGPKDFYARSCRACYVPQRPLLGLFGPAHPAWRGGTQIDRDGYTRTYDPAHPWPRRGGYVFEHVRVMELRIGRRIATNETVHHLDHNRENNALSNLQLMTRAEHSRHHRGLDTHTRLRLANGRFA